MRKRKLQRMLAMLMTAAMLLTGIDAAGTTVHAESTEAVTNVVYEDDMENDADGWNVTWSDEENLGTAERAANEYASNNKTKWWSFKTQDAANVITLTKTVTGLSAGKYTVSVDVAGGDFTGTIKLSDANGNATEAKELTIGGWDAFETNTSETLTMSEASDVTITIVLDSAVAGWTDLDNINLIQELSTDAAKDAEIAALNTLLTTCKGLTESEYKPASWSALQSQITAAQEVYNSAADKTLEEITAAKNALQAVKDALVYATVVENAGINVKRVDGITDDFIRGVDISTYASLIDSGVKFKGWDGKDLETDVAFFELLKDAGVNYVRIRVWNDPYDADGNGYGAGNCDVEKATKMGKWATDAGLKVLIDFHYSDFWADPGRQVVPKAWDGMDIDQKAAALKTFTTESLNTMIDAGVDVSMVQVGNETNGKLSGENSWGNICKLFSAGSEAVRGVSAAKNKDILVALHFTDPHAAGRLAGFASTLKENNVDYDVFASSYYPFWHGTPENLTKVLKDIATTYEKKVMVAETSWAYTLKDGDGQLNVVRVGNNDSNPAYAFTIQGQANEVRDVIEAVKNVGDAGIGMFYWEPAWLPVNVYDENADNAAEVLAANKTAWDRYGSGWASVYSIDYDPNVDEGNYGGSEWDNQAMIDFYGNPLPSLNVYKYVATGASTPRKVDNVINPGTIEAVLGSDIASLLPTEVQVEYNDGTKETCTVIWNKDDIDEIGSMGVYTIKGTVSYTADGVTETTEASCLVDVSPINLLANGDFELNKEHWVTEGTGIKSNWVDDVKNGTYALGFYSDKDFSFTAAHSFTVTEAGYYSAYMYSEGSGMGDNGETSIKLLNVTKEKETLAQNSTLQGWKVWQKPMTDDIEAEAGDELKVLIKVSGIGGGWGSIDDVCLYRSDFSITYELNGGVNNADNPVSYLKTSEITFKDPTREGYVFDGWYKDSAFTKKITGIAKGSSGNIKLYAKWKQNQQQQQPPKTFTVTLDVNGGKTMNGTTMTVTEGGTYGTLPSAQRVGYTFNGWFTAKTGGQQITSGGKVSITQNTILYAQWKKVTAPGKMKKKPTVKNTKKNTIKVSYKKVTGAEGYEIRYAAKSSMKGAKKVTSKKLSATIKNKKIKKGSTYYVQVRAYKTDSTGKKVYCKTYSPKAKVKIKK